MKVGDICKVIKKSPTVPFNVLGQFGFVTKEIDDEFVDIIMVKADGSFSGSGSVERDCLRQIFDPQWLRAKELYFEIREKAAKAFQERTIQYDKHLSTVAEKHDLTIEKVKEIISDIYSFRYEDVS